MSHIVEDDLITDEDITCHTSYQSIGTRSLKCQNCRHAEKAADVAVKKTFAILGVDVDKPESIEAFREDLRFGHKLRKAADQGLLVIMGVLFAGLVVAFADKFWK